ncbi:MAG: DoxX family protein [Propioniciclava sp.]
MADESTSEYESPEGARLAADAEEIASPASPVAVLEEERPSLVAESYQAARSLPDETNSSVSVERARLQAEREARRAAREAALRPPPDRPDPVAFGQALDEDWEASPPAAERVVIRRSTDGFLPSLALFVLRVVVAAILGIRGVGVLLDLPGTTELLATTILPAPAILAMVLGGAQVAIAVALLFGLLTRLAGLGVLLVAGGALAFVLWGPWSPFQAGQPGFSGELELLLAAVGLMLIAVGSGGWGLDRGFRSRRAERRRTEV